MNLPTSVRPHFLDMEAEAVQMMLLCAYNCHGNVIKNKHQGMILSE